MHNKLTDTDVSALVSAIDTIWLLTNFIILSMPQRPSLQLLESAVTRINSTCESLEPIMSKFDA